MKYINIKRALQAREIKLIKDLFIFKMMFNDFLNQ
jgi:hypothetical protein